LDDAPPVLLLDDGTPRDAIVVAVCRGGCMIDFDDIMHPSFLARCQRCWWAND
jgi:hypothetical protein